ncbi:hypothetical protein [uncultured Metabacillus sp.]|nr:hypothetical protein [uncultured Metabacillus sp.]
MKQFVFIIDSDELVIKANSILEAVAKLKEIAGENRNLKFKGIKY